jgi:hypothetical protein
VTPAEIIATVERMPLSPAMRQALLRAALAGQRWALITVRLHAWRQSQPARPGARWLNRLWRRWWR